MIAATFQTIRIRRRDVESDGGNVGLTDAAAADFDGLFEAAWNYVRANPDHGAHFCRAKSKVWAYAEKMAPDATYPDAKFMAVYAGDDKAEASAAVYDALLTEMGAL